MNRKAKVVTEEYYGGCPKCGHTDGYISSGRGWHGWSWFVCDKHNVKWESAYGPWGSSKRLTDGEIELGRALLTTYREVKPIWPDDEVVKRMTEFVVYHYFPMLDNECTTSRRIRLDAAQEAAKRRVEVGMIQEARAILRKVAEDLRDIGPGERAARKRRAAREEAKWRDFDVSAETKRRIRKFKRYAPLRA